MNLHQIVSSAIGTVNPFITVTIRRSTGYSTLPDGTRISTYVTLSGPAQVQDLAAEQLRQLEGLNLQGETKNVYINGNWSGAVRADAVGGDVFLFLGAEWLVTLVPESWPDWCKVVVTMQSPRPPALPM